MKKLICFLLLTCALQAQSKELTIRWFGTTNFVISDGQTNLLFDPFFTRPSLSRVLFGGELKSDPLLIKETLEKSGIKSINSIFISHTHYDHALDLEETQKLYNSKVVGPVSTKQILLKNKKTFRKVVPNSSIIVGKFRVIPLKGKHPPHIFNMTFWDGEIKDQIKPLAKAYDYKLGENYSYLIEHPSGNILFHPSSAIYDPKVFETKLSKKKINTLILGIASRSSSELLINTIIKKLKPSTLIPAHHDNFFKPLSEGFSELMTINSEEFKETLTKSEQNTPHKTKYLELEYYKIYKLK